MNSHSSDALSGRAGRYAACLVLAVATFSQTARSAPNYATATLANNPAAFWQLNETGDPSTGTLPATDSSPNGRNGTYGTTSLNGYSGVVAPQPPTFNGFAAGQGALYTIDPTSVVTLPALNMSSTVVDTTIAMWINPLGQPPADCGLLFDRSGGAANVGFGFAGQDTTLGLTRLGYNWNDTQATWGWNSSLYPPVGVWSFVALVIQTNRATVYMYYLDPNNGKPVLASAVNNTTHSAATWSGGGPRWLGGDSFNTSRIFPGYISGAAIYNSALSRDQVLGLFAAGLGVNGFAPSISQQPRSQYVLSGSPARLSATADGSSPLTYQWKLNGTDVNLLPNATNYTGANSNVLSILSTTASEVGTYQLFVSNPLGTTPSANVAVTIHAPAVVGKWFTNDSLAEVSGFTAAGTHTGVPIGGMAYSFTNDVPSGKSGHSLVLASASGISIQNSSTLDSGYVNTFDERINSAFTVAIWAKGWPAGWNPFVSKYGETSPAPSGGWQLRQNGQNNQNPCWTIRGAGGTVTLGTAVYGNSEDLAATSLALGGDTNNWHYYVGTYDTATRIRNLYVDGILAAQETNNALYLLSPSSFLCIGARDSGGNVFGNFFEGQIYDARIYNYALSQAEVLQEYGVVPPAVAVQPNSPAVLPGRSISLNATVSGTPPLGFKWQLNGTDVSLLPNAANYTGANSNVLTILSATASEVGNYRLIVTNLYGTAISSNGVVSLAEGKIVGRWFSGAPTLADVSGHQPAGTHDGFAVGGGEYTFTNDVPPGMTGQSIRLSNNSGIAIMNSSSTVDPYYTNTFDDAIRTYMTVTFWAKGWPGQWNPLVSKFGESAGWQIRRQNDANNVAWTIRGAGGTVTLGTAVFGNADDTATTGLSLASQTGYWHYYAATYNSTTGERLLFIDGVLRARAVNNTLYNMAPQSYLTIGARDAGSGVFGNFFNGMLYDVRVYNYDIATNDIIAAWPDPLVLNQPPQAVTAYEGTIVQIAATASTLATPATYQWQRNGADLANGNLDGAVISGAHTNTLTISYVTPAVAGTYRLLVTNPAGTVVSSNSVVTVLPTAPPPAANLVGSWITCEANLKDTSGFQPAGTHDGYGVSGMGVPSDAYAFTNDVPPGATGNSLLLTGSAAIAISNSCTLDAAYLNTFDEGIASMTVTFWAKGWPSGTWNPFVSKWGESGQGWQLRRNGGNSPCWTIRGEGANEDMSAIGLTMSNDGAWHHYAGTYTFNSGTGTGTRTLYVDGLLRATRTETVPYVYASGSHLAIGGRDNGGNNFGNLFTGSIHGVRIYNVALSEAQVNSFRVSTAPPTVPAFSGPPVVNGNQLVLTWTGGTLLQSTNVAGPWTSTGATSPHTNNVTSGPRMFYKLSNP